MSKSIVVDREALVACAKELQEVIDIEPPIELEADNDGLKKQIRKVIEFIEPGDEFSEETQKTIEGIKTLLPDVPEDEEQENQEQEDEEEEQTHSNQEEGEKEVKKEKVKKEKVKKEKVKKEKGPKGSSRTAEYVAFITPLIEKGKYTRAEVMEKTVGQFPDAKSALQTLLSDGKNPKYCQFAHLIVQNKEGVISFGKKRG